MATSKAIRADDVSGLNIATVQQTEDAITKDWQRVVLNSPGTAGNMAEVTASSALKVDISATAANATAIKVDGSAVTQPVSVAATLNVRPSDGTNPITVNFDADTGAGTQYLQGVLLRQSGNGGSVEVGTSTTPLQVSLANTAANATAVKVDGSAVTQPVSAASLPLPTGAATAAKQPALGTAGAASADVITVQGIASMTALKVDGSGVTQPVSGTVTANQGGTWTVQPGNTANTTPWLISQIPGTSGGCSVFNASVTTVQSVKGSAGQIYGYHILNTTAAVAYVQVFNVASGSVTLGTTAPTFVLGIPASGGATFGLGPGVAMGTAISVACTTTRSGSTTAACEVTIYYK